MTKQTSLNLNTSLSQLDKLLDKYLVKKAPTIPKQIKELIVNFGPYLIIISLFFAIPSVLALFGLNTLSIPMRSFGRLGFTYTLSTIVLLINLVLEVLALPGLLKKQASAWKLIYYAALINAVHSLLLFNLGAFLIGSLISFYILFQIKSYYK